MTEILSAFFDNEALLCLDLKKNIKYCNFQLLKLFGLKQLPVGTRFDDVFDLATDYMKDCAVWQPFCAIYKPTGAKADGILRCDKNGYRFIFCECGQRERICPLHFDQKHVSLLFSNMREGVAIHRLVFKAGKAVDYIIEGMNESFAAMFGLERKKAVGRLASSLFDNAKAPFINKFASAVQSEQPSQFDIFYSRLNRHYLFSVTPWDKSHFGTVVSDLSQSRYSQMLYKALNEAAADISNVVEMDKLFDGTEKALRKNGFECMLILLNEEAVATETYQSFSEPKRIEHKEQPCMLDKICSDAVAKRRTAYIESLNMHKILSKAGYDKDLKCIVSPLTQSGKLIGIFAVLSTGLKQRDVDAVTAFANQLAAIIEKVALIKDLRAHIVKLEMSRKAHKDAAERLKLASSASRVGVWDIDLIRKVEYIDSTLEKIYGIEPDSFDGNIKTQNKYIHPDDSERVKKAFYDALKGNANYSVEYRIVLKDGTIRHISSTGMLHKDENADPIRMVGTDWDITESKKAELALMAEKELMAATLRSIGDGVVVTDKDGRVTLANAQFEQISGLERAQIDGRLLGELFITVNKGSNDTAGFSIIEKALRTGRVYSYSDCEMIRKDEKIVPVAYTAAPIKDSKSEICGSVVVIRDITQEKKKQERIDFLLYHDTLTGVFNRRYFNMMLRKYDTKNCLPISILSCDVNGLKLTNDAFGHDAGDRLLQRMASIMERSVRANDIVARIGGDEFYILLPNADELQAIEICERIEELAANSRKLEIDSTISIGIGTKYKIDEKISTIIKMAESKMYRTKTFKDSDRKDNLINNILQTLHKKRPCEKRHAQSVSNISAGIAKQMGLSQREIEEIKIAGLMHDIGKIALPENIFNKREALSEAEWAEIKRHCEIGFRIISTSVDLAYIAKTVIAHHERFDGKGYPSGLKAEEIPLAARILAVADAYDAMTNERPYRLPFNKSAALKEISDCSGTQFDPKVVDMFFKFIQKDDEKSLF